MSSTVELPLWLFSLILLFAAVTFASHFLFPSVRWFFRRRLERVVARVNQRLDRPIQPFKLARRYDTIQRLIYDPEVIRAAADHARAEGIPENVAVEMARRYAREIVPSFSASVYFGIAIRMARWLSNALYRVELGRGSEAALSGIDPDATVVFVMNHRSNMDYVLVTYLAARRSALSYAVGEWAHVWPLSSLIRAMGAYFIRRRSRNELYRKVLARYVQLATEAGVSQAMFPEGQLSRTGALGEPKLGLLKYIVDGAAQAERDVVFVPVALNYDRVLEDRTLVAAAKAPGRRFTAGIGIVMRNAAWLLWLWLRGRYHRYGYAAVHFGQPVSLTRVREQVEGDPTEELAHMLMARIADIVPVLTVPLLSALLLDRGGMTKAEAEVALAEAARDLPKGRVHLARGGPERAAEIGLKFLGRWGAVTVVDGRHIPVEAERPLLEFYANSIRHLLPDLSAGAKEISAPARS